MLLNSSETPNSQQPTEEVIAGPRSYRAGRRLSLAILLPVWVATGFLLSQLILAALVIGLKAVGISVSGINMVVLNAVFSALSYVLTLVIVLGLPNIIRKSRTTIEDIGLNRLPIWQDFAQALGGFVVYILLAGVLLSVVTKYIPGFNAEQTQDVGFSQLNGRYQYILAFLTLVVIAPVAEEILMRGYLYGKLRKIIGVAMAMVVTAVTFGILHLQWNVAVDVFALSLILTSLREVSGSIWPGILVHMTKNGLAFYLLFINTALSHTMGG